MADHRPPHHRSGEFVPTHDDRQAADLFARGACLGADPDLFFPERGAPSQPAKDICAGCDVRAACLDFALDRNERFGIWGGTSERERRRIRRQRRIEAA